jgi:hypothetical protein
MKLLAILAVLSIGAFAQAHPVSFKKGFGVMSYNSSEMNEVLLTYSFTHRIAAATTFLNDGDSEFLIPRANFLLKRWNNDDSQGNIYLSAGSGIETYDNKGSSAHLGEFIADWESRKYYTYFEQLYIKRDNHNNPLIPEQDYNRSKLRLGFAPFLADYSDLNVWFITQFDRGVDKEKIDATQFLRFYIKNVLWEVGAGFNGNFAFNFMIHI